MLSIRYVGRVILFGLKTIKLVKNWTILFSFFQKNKKNLKIKLKNNLEFYSNGDIADLVVIIEIFDKESKYDYFIENYSTNVKNIIDIGANIGAFGIYAAKKYFNSLVYCYEPDKINFELLRKNLKFNKIENVLFYNQAIGKSSGKVLLYSQEGKNFGTANSSTVRQGSKSIQVECTTLENIIKDNQISECDLLKLDCEGAEYDIIFNTSPETFSKIKSISIEYHNLPEGHGNDLQKFLEKLDYEVILIPTKRNPSTGYIYARR